MQIEYDNLISSLRKLDDNVNSGPDMIPLYFIKRCILSLAQPVFLLPILATGIIPS